MSMSKEDDIKIESLEDTVNRLIQADKVLCSLDGNGWPKTDVVFPEWESCSIDLAKIPKLDILRKPGEANGKEHGKPLKSQRFSKRSSTIFADLTRRQSRKV